MRSASVITITLLIVPSLLIAGCMDDEEGPTRPIKDMLGREVLIPMEVESIVGIEAGALRLLVYMEQTDKVVGIEEHERSGGPGGNAKPYIFAHQDLLELPSIGPMHGGDAELLVSTGPDVIFWTFTDRTKADDLQEKTGIPVVGLEYGDLGESREKFYEALHLVGEVMRNLERAQEIEDFIESRISQLNDLTGDLDDTPSFYVGGVGYRGSHGILSTEPSYSSLEFVGGNNVASSLGQEHAYVDKEKIIDWDPDVILIDEGGVQTALEELGDGTYDTVRAVKDSRVYGLLPYNWYTINMGTVLGNSYYIADLILRDNLEDIDPVKETDDIYEFLVGERVYDWMAEEFGGYKELEV